MVLQWMLTSCCCYRSWNSSACLRLTRTCLSMGSSWPMTWPHSVVSRFSPVVSSCFRSVGLSAERLQWIVNFSFFFFFFCFFFNFFFQSVHFPAVWRIVFNKKLICILFSFYYWFFGYWFLWCPQYILFITVIYSYMASDIVKNHSAREKLR